MNKKIKVRLLKNGWKKEGLTDWITIRQAEGWLFSDAISKRKSVFEIIDERVDVIISYPKYLEGKKEYTIKFKEILNNGS